MSPNALLQKLLAHLKAQPTLIPFIAQFIADATTHLRNRPNQEFMSYPVQELVQRFADSGADMATPLLQAPADASKRGGATNRYDRSSATSRTKVTRFDKPHVSAIIAGSAQQNDDDSEADDGSVPGLQQKDDNSVTSSEPSVDGDDGNDEDETKDLEDEDDDRGIDQPAEESKLHQELKTQAEADLDAILNLAQNHPAIVNAIITESNECDICNDGTHTTIQCYYLLRENMPLPVQRRIRQIRLRLQDQIKERLKELKDKGPEEKMPPKQREARIQPKERKQAKKFDPPHVSAISAEQKNAIKHFAAEHRAKTCEAEPIGDDAITTEELQNVASLTEMLKELSGTKEISTPTVCKIDAGANVNVMNRETANSMIVDFSDDNGVLVPIHAEHDDDLVPEDYDAYMATDSVNW